MIVYAIAVRTRFGYDLSVRKYLRKADIILFIVLIVSGIAASVALPMLQSAAGPDAKVVIKSGGRLFAVYSLYEDREITVPAPEKAGVNSGDGSGGNRGNCNVVRISGGSVSVIKATCTNQVCVRHKSISKSGENIVCLPNRLVISIESGKGGEYDTITS